MAGEALIRIQEKLNLLVKQYQLLQQENVKLKHMLRQAGEKETAMAASIGQLQQQVVILKTATNQLDEQDKKELEKRLNHYLKEIDRCINMLGV
jgi:ABC-type iron transport system FetAB ATPase subunit